MSKLTEKLGIKQIKRDPASRIKISQMWKYIVVDNKDLEKLEQQNAELLEALVENMYRWDAYLGKYICDETMQLQNNNERAVKRIDPQHRSWPEIKQLIEE